VIRDRVLKILDDLGVQYAVVGAVAVAARGVVRSTLDLDLLTTDTRVLRESVWAGLPDVDVRKGDSNDPLAGVVRIGPKAERIDIVVGRWKWEQRVIERAQPAEVQGAILRVPITSDLILLKLSAGGSLDQQDIVRLLAVGPRDQLIAEVNEKIVELPIDAQQLWTRLIAS
jgi:hypothetical protein